MYLCGSLTIPSEIGSFALLVFTIEAINSGDWNLYFVFTPLIVAILSLEYSFAKIPIY